MLFRPLADETLKGGEGALFLVCMQTSTAIGPLPASTVARCLRLSLNSR